MQKIIKQVIELAKKKRQNKLFLEFVEKFYSHNSPHDFVNYDVEEFYKLALENFNFCQEKPSKTKVRIIKNPHQDVNQTIVDIINDDMPFLVDSSVSMLEEKGFDIQNIIHPIYHIKRDKKGALLDIKTNKTDDKDYKKESIIQLHIKGFIDEEEQKNLISEITKLLQTVDIVVCDWKKIVKKTEEIKTNIKNTEYQEFLDWLVEKGFIFLGFKEFSYAKKQGKYHLDPDEKSALGVFRAKCDNYRPGVANAENDDIIDSIKTPYILEILKSSYKSRIHRFANAERIRIQKFSDKGQLVGEYRIIGLFTSAAYHQDSLTIPIIRTKISNVIEKSGYEKGSHNYKDLISVLEDYPRDELFQILEQDLLRIATGIVMICGRNKIKFFARKDKFGRFISCLVFMPKDRGNAELRARVRKYIAKRYNGEIADNFVQITELNLVRLQIIIRVNDKNTALQELAIEKEITELAKPWSESLREEIQAQHPGKTGNELFKKYRESFSVSYINRFNARRAALDVATIDKAINNDQVLFKLYKSSQEEPEIAELKIYSPQKELYLSDVMPVLESFGLNVIHEHTYLVKAGEKNLSINYFRLNLGEIKLNDDLKLRFEEAISLAWNKILSIGSLNRLLIHSNLDWKEVFVIRAYAKYLYQAGFRHDQEYVSNILVKNGVITKLLLELFSTKFDPNLKISHKKRQEKIAEITKKIENHLHKVPDASHDIAIRKFFNLIKGTLRTNFYQCNEDGCFKGYISFKLDCKNIPDLPLPLPHAEIFVFSNKMEGSHLRGGKVARGGLRWSDRQEDFRTEVLGLVKAQMTKNAVIVPVGSKGAFVVKKDLSGLSREEFMEEGISCYKTFLRGILDLTDNVIDGNIIHPENAILHDDADPYLVVAADKGTATFSDIANSISKEYNFWLGDAFASGGSEGYDHKKMGITAKGAWVCVMRHFREMGRDTQSQDFTCVGVGDMGGDVFGNGMLLSPHTRLVAAFNHMHIFIDPNPDAKKSYKERQRLFALPRSSWEDYNKSLISNGGGIFNRNAKSIKISKHIQKALDITESELTPDQLITAILKAPVDLLWNGGIGTYVKSASESNADVGDKANDKLRINGQDLRCKVVGEGGNLGFTQQGRIEYALNGGRINTDAMDNSAGVDCSDHEVNIKIALNEALRHKKITIKQRNKILESMTEEVAALVLKDNYTQSQAITIASHQGYSANGIYGQFLKKLEKNGLLDRKIEFLPSNKELQKRQAEKIGLTRPELCVILSYAKMEIYQELLSSKLPDDKFFTEDLQNYFPKEMHKKFSDEIQNHQLRREIIATQITNSVVDYGGITFVNQICQESAYTIPEIVKCYIIAINSFDLSNLWQEIQDKQNPSISNRVYAQMFFSINKLLERSVLWLLRNRPKGDLTSTISRFKAIADDLSSFLTEVLAKDSREAFEKKCELYRLSNIETNLAAKVAKMNPIASTFDIAEISAKSKFSLKTIAKIYYQVGTRFSLKWLRSTLSDLPCDGYWERLSSKSLVEDLYSYQMRIAQKIVDATCDADSCDTKSVEEWIKNAGHLSVEQWTKSVGFLVERYDNFITDIKSNSNHDISMFIVAINRLKPLLQ